MSEKDIEVFLIELLKKDYDCADDYFARKTKKGNWIFGYSNDYPLQHGEGKNYELPNAIVEHLFTLLTENAELKKKVESMKIWTEQLKCSGNCAKKSDCNQPCSGRWRSAKECPCDEWELVLNKWFEAERLSNQKE